MSVTVAVALITGGFTLAAGLLTSVMQWGIQHRRDVKADRRAQLDAVKIGVTKLNDSRKRFFDAILEAPSTGVIHHPGGGLSVTSEDNLRKRQRDHYQRAFYTFNVEAKSTFLEMSFGISDETVRTKFQSTLEHWNNVVDQMHPDNFEDLESYIGAVDRYNYAELSDGLAGFAFDAQKALLGKKG